MSEIQSQIRKHKRQDNIYTPVETLRYIRTYVNAGALSADLKLGDDLIELINHAYPEANIPQSIQPLESRSTLHSSENWEHIMDWANENSISRIRFDLMKIHNRKKQENYPTEFIAFLKNLNLAFKDTLGPLKVATLHPDVSTTHIEEISTKYEQ
ncbi:hypothetical protein PCE1_000472 [Barthelona sp. PCE]